MGMIVNNLDVIDATRLELDFDKEGGPYLEYQPGGELKGRFSLGGSCAGLLIALSIDPGRFTSKKRLLADVKDIFQSIGLQRFFRYGPNTFSKLPKQAPWLLRRGLRGANVPCQPDFRRGPNSPAWAIGRLVTTKPPDHLLPGLEADGVNLHLKYGTRGTSTDLYSYLLLCEVLGEDAPQTWRDLDEMLFDRTTSRYQRYVMTREITRIIRRLELPGELAVTGGRVRMLWDVERGARRRSAARVSLFEQVEPHISQRTSIPTRRALRLILDAKGSIVSNEDLAQRAWGRDVHRTSILDAVRRAYGQVAEQLHDRNTFLLEIPRRGYRTVKTKTLSPDTSTSCDGKTLLLKGPRRTDDEPLPIQQYLLLQKLLDNEGNTASRRELDGSIGRTQTTKILDSLLDDLNERLQRVGSPSRALHRGSNVVLVTSLEPEIDTPIANLDGDTSAIELA